MYDTRHGIRNVPGRTRSGYYKFLRPLALAGQLYSIIEVLETTGGNQPPSNSWVAMKPYQQSFIELARAVEALKFGEFTLKSGRLSPYFFNAGAFCTGSALAVIGQCYAAAIVESGVEFDVLLGPAYKGIPLAASVAWEPATGPVAGSVNAN